MSNHRLSDEVVVCAEMTLPEAAENAAAAEARHAHELAAPFWEHHLPLLPPGQSDLGGEEAHHED